MMFAHMVSIDPARNRYRGYIVAIQPTLFSPYALVRSWGRVGSRPRMLVREMASAAQAREEAMKLMALRLRRGYRVIQVDDIW